MKSYVYFVQAETGQIKIGFSCNMPSRLRQLRTACPVELKLLGVVEGNKAKERVLQEQFYQYNIRGEWFNPSPELCSAIKNLIDPRLDEEELCYEHLKELELEGKAKLEAYKQKMSKKTSQ